MSIRRALTSRVFDPIFWGRVKGRRVFPRLAEFRERQWDAPGALADRTDGALGRLLAHAVSNVAFYADGSPDLSPEDAVADPRGALSAFPILEKADVSSRRDDMKVEMGRRTYPNRTGGSTGEPVLFYQDSVYQAAAMATTFLFYEWAHFGHGERHVKLWGAPRDIGSGRVPARSRLADWLGNRVTLDAFDMTPATMSRYEDVIDRERPVCVEGYADGLLEMASHMTRTGRSIAAPVCVVSSAGTLFPHMRAAIEEAFGAPVFDRYGTREVGNVAAECDRHEGLHVFSETTFMEVVGPDGSPVAPGEEGEIIVTNLWNYTMPLIRYRIGDRAVPSAKTCSCGRGYPLLERLAGRTESVIVLGDGRTILPEFFIHVVGVEQNEGFVRKFQVVQERRNELVIRIVPTEGGAAEVARRESDIVARVKGAAGETCGVRVELVDAIAPTPTGKHMYVVSKVRRDGD